MRNCREYHASIQLWVDGELSGGEREEFLHHAQDCASCAQAMREADRFSLRVRAARPPITAPDSLRTAVLRQLQEREFARKATITLPRKMSAHIPRWSMMAVAAALALAAGSTLASYLQRQRAEAAMVRTAVVAYQQLEQNTLPMDVSSDSPQTVSAWFQQRVRFQFRMADSGVASAERAKYRLTGGRLLMVGNEPVAMLTFTLQHAMVSLLIGPGHLMRASGGAILSSGGIDMHSHEEGSLHVVTWNHQGLSYVLIFSNSVQRPEGCASCHQDQPAGRNNSQTAMVVSRIRDLWPAS